MSSRAYFLMQLDISIPDLFQIESELIQILFDTVSPLDGSLYHFLTLDLCSGPSSDIWTMVVISGTLHAETLSHNAVNIDTIDTN